MVLTLAGKSDDNTIAILLILLSISFVFINWLKMETNKDIFVRNLEIECCNVSLTFIQKSVGMVSCVIWDAALVLAKYFDFTNKKSNWLKGKTVLELGAGMGCAGLSAACLGAHVILTDLKNALPMLEDNIKVNEKIWKNFGGIVEARILEWGKEINIDVQPDIIILTDCVYYEESIKPLLDTLESLCSNKYKTYALLSQEKRDTPKQILIWKQFITELNSRFKVEYIPTFQQHPIYSSSDIYLMKIFNSNVNI